MAALFRFDNSQEVPQLWAPRRVGDWVDRIKHGGRLGEQVKDFFKDLDKFDVFCKLEIIVEWICVILLALY